MVPESYNKMLANIRKEQQRIKKKKALGDDKDEDDDEFVQRTKPERSVPFNVLKASDTNGTNDTTEIRSFNKQGITY